MSEKLTDRGDVNASVSAGAGIAIAGVWLAGAAVTIILLLTIFVWSPTAATIGSSLNSDSAFLLILLIAAPLIVAYFITKTILSKD